MFQSGKRSFTLRRVALAPRFEGGEGDGSGSGGAPAGGNGGTSSGVTEERVNEILNKALAKRFGEFETKQSKAQEKRDADTIEKISTLFDERLETIRPKLDEKDGKGGKTPSAEDIANHPIVKGLQKQLEQLTKSGETLKQERAAERAEARSLKLRKTASEKLHALQIEGKYADHALDHLIDARKRIQFASDESDEIVFVDGEAQISLEDGLKDWAKSDDGKLYLPPRGASGSGDGAERGKKPGAKTENNLPSKAELGTALAHALSRGG